MKKEKNKIMEKKLKNKCIIASILIVIGVICIYLSLNIVGLSELQSNFINGFGTGLTVVSIVVLVKFIMALSNPEKLKKVGIEFTDERLKQIRIKSMAIAFRISLILEAFFSILLVIFDYKLGMYLGLLITYQIIVFAVANIVISKKI